MKVLFLEMPSREKNSAPPYGVLYAAGAVMRSGYEAKIVDYCNKALSDVSLAREVDGYRPDIIAFGGITSSYRNLKNSAEFLKGRYPEIPLIAGGVISSIDELLLKRAKIDLVVLGEGESIIPLLLRHYNGELAIDNVPGIAYLEGFDIRRTPAQAQVAALDDIPVPPYELLDMEKYLYPSKDWIEHYYRFNDSQKSEIVRKMEKTPYMLAIMTSRGCTHRCIFCYRHMKGIRQHSVPYVIEHMKFLKKKYGVGLFQFCDELTTANRKWIFDLCDAIEREALDINFIVLSARVDTVDEEMLRRLKKAGCVMLNYGFESGSDIILKEIRKGVTREDNLRAARLVKKAGIKNVPEIMIGFPSETDETIADTISFLKDVSQYPFSVNYVLPFPKTPLWDYCIEKGMIKDEEEFILNYGEAAHFSINLTGLPDKKVKSWWTRVMHQTMRHMYLKNKDINGLAKIEAWAFLRRSGLWRYAKLLRGAGKK
jgi:radical SAM superfamily enzyme YgiQ (UPF0313 family)